MNKQKGIASMVIMVTMLVMAVALPIATRLVQQSQENRSKAAAGYSGTCQTSCTANGICSGSPFFNNRNNARMEADCLCATSDVSGCSNKYYINRSGAPAGCVMTKTSWHSSPSDCTRVAGTKCYASYSDCAGANTATPTVSANCSGTRYYWSGSSCLSGDAKRYCSACGGDYSCYNTLGGCTGAHPTVHYTRGACDSDGYYKCTSSASGAYTTLDSCETKCTTTTSKHYTVYKNGSCQTSSNTYTSLAACNADPPINNCYDSLEKCKAAHPTTTYTCSAKTCSANYGCMRNGVFTSSDAACTTPIGTVPRTYDANCPKRNGAGGGDDNACQAACSPNCSCASSTLIGQTCSNGCGGTCSGTKQSTTYTCSDKACSANYGCMRNGVFTSSDAACTTPIGTVPRTYDANCPRISDDVLATLGSSGNNDACQITTSCTSGEKQCSDNILQKCNSDGTAWETDIDCGDLGCDAATKACKVVSSTCDDIPTTCSDKDFTAYKAKGDFNCDETVDIIDFSLWKGWFNADKEQCGSITDFNIWKDAFNKSN